MGIRGNPAGCFKTRDGTVTNRTVYVVMGINMEGERDILGLWVGPTSGESPKFWLGVLTELRNRGIADVLMLCCDGLKGLPDSARAVWPLVDVQLCVVHLVRNSLRFASKKHWGQITKQLKAIYTAPSLTAAEDAFEEFAETWEAKYPAMVKSWFDTWDDFIAFLEFRKIVYSTDEIVKRQKLVSVVASERRGLRRRVLPVRRVPSRRLVAPGCGNRAMAQRQDRGATVHRQRVRGCDACGRRGSAERRRSPHLW